MRLGNGEFTMKKFDERLGYVLKQERKAKKLYQSQVAKKINVSKMTISYWERGLHTMSAEQLINYCKALDIPVQEVFDRMDQ